MKFFNLNKTRPTTDLIGGAFFLIMGWLIFFVKPSEELTHMGPKSSLILIFEWVAKTIGIYNYLIIMNAIGLILFIKGIKKIAFANKSNKTPV